MTADDDLTIKIFADGADAAEMARLRNNPAIKGFTTNPTLMRKAGVADCRAFAGEIAAAVPDLPVSFEVFADEFAEMERQAMEIAGWGANFYVKIPITNSAGESSAPVLTRLAGQGVNVNVTAMLTAGQVDTAVAALTEGGGAGVSAFVSVFAGRIADTGRDPVPVMRDAVRALDGTPNIELIWASPREVYDIVRADAIGCDVITVTYGLLEKMKLFGKDLDEFSLETVRMFVDDAAAAGYRI